MGAIEPDPLEGASPRPGRASRSDGAGIGHNIDRAGKASFPRVYTDWPDRFPVLAAEVDLIEAYMPELIDAMIANDNDE